VGILAWLALRGIRADAAALADLRLATRQASSSWLPANTPSRRLLCQYALVRATTRCHKADNCSAGRELVPSFLLRALCSAASMQKLAPLGCWRYTCYFLPPLLAAERAQRFGAYAVRVSLSSSPAPVTAYTAAIAAACGGRQRTQAACMPPWPRRARFALYAARVRTRALRNLSTGETGGLLLAFPVFIFCSNWRRGGTE